MKFRFPHILMAAALLAGLTSFDQKAPEKFQKGNLHTHTLWSDGNALPEEVARWYREHEYQFLAITDHNLLQEGTRYRKLGQDSVKLQEFSELSRVFDTPGEFLLLRSEEISDGAEKRPVHLNGFNLTSVVKPTGGKTTGECTAANTEAIRKALAKMGNPEWITVNHPNFGWGLSADDLARSSALFFEVFNGHPSVRNYGDSIHPSTERMWDLANRWRIDHGKPILMAVATDDAHHYDQFSSAKANPGRGWVMVRTGSLTPESLYGSMSRGDFYASTGISLMDFNTGKKGISIRIAEEPGVTYTTEFIGWLKGKDQPEVLKSAVGTRPSYRFTGKELFVRARIISSKIKENPYAAGDREMAWLQPVRVQ